MMKGIKYLVMGSFLGASPAVAQETRPPFDLVVPSVPSTSSPISGPDILYYQYKFSKEDNGEAVLIGGSEKIRLQPIDVNKQDYNEQAERLDLNSLDGSDLLKLQASELSPDQAADIQKELRQPTSNLSKMLLGHLINTDVAQWYDQYESSPDIVKRFIEDHASGRYYSIGNTELNKKLWNSIGKLNGKLKLSVSRLAGGINRNTKSEIVDSVSMSYALRSSLNSEDPEL